MRVTLFKNEMELAKVVIGWLEKDGHQVFQEVQPFQYSGPAADIVAMSENGPGPGPKRKTWIIECKLNLTIVLLHQCLRWQGYSHFISAAVPYPSSNSPHHLWERIYRHFGIGLIYVHKSTLPEKIEDRVSDMISPKIQENIVDRSGRWLIKTLDFLAEHHKSVGVAGAKNAKKITPFEITKQNLVHVVKSHPGITMKEAVKQIESHHYSRTEDAVSALSNWVKNGVIDELRFEKIDRRNHLYLREKKEQKDGI